MASDNRTNRYMWLPDVPFPSVPVDAHPKVGIFVNREWGKALLSLVEHADQPRFWEGGDPFDIEQQAIRLFEIILKATGMIGAIIPYYSRFPPAGTLPCDGSTYQREDYPALYAALEYDLHLNADEFKTPDFRGRFILAAQGDIYPKLSESGEAEHVLTIEELASHNHTTLPHSHTNAPHEHTYSYPSVGIDVEAPGAPDFTAVGNPGIPDFTGQAIVSIDETQVDVNFEGSDVAHNNMPPYIALNYAIVAL